MKEEISQGNAAERETTAKFELSQAQREQVLGILEKQNYISHTPDGKVIADLEKIDNYSTHTYTKEYNDILRTTKHGGFFVLQHVFDKVPVISKSDWGKKSRR